MVQSVSGSPGFPAEELRPEPYLDSTASGNLFRKCKISFGLANITVAVNVKKGGLTDVAAGQLVGYLGSQSTMASKARCLLLKAWFIANAAT